MSSSTAQVLREEPLESGDAKWINLVKITYRDGGGRERQWEAMRRTTRPRGSAVDAVLIVAVLTSPGGGADAEQGGPALLLEKQFRPPAGRVVVELPAGLVDEGETPEQAALRELREETGYIGTVRPDGASRRPVLHSSPASSSSCNYMIHVAVDLDDPANRTPRPQLEEGEFIECFTVPLKNLYSELRALEAQGFAIDGKLGALAEGLEMARAWQV